MDTCCRCRETIGSQGKLGNYRLSHGVGMGAEPVFQPGDTFCWGCYCQWRADNGAPVPPRLLDEGAEGCVKRLVEQAAAQR